MLNINLKSCNKLEVIYDSSFIGYKKIEDLELNENVRIEEYETER